MKNIYILVLIAVIACSSCMAPPIQLTPTIPVISRQRPARMLSSFFGLDNALPPNSVVLWLQAPGKDGMPVVFTHEIDPSTLSANVFRITTRNDSTFTPAFVTLSPANEEFELRTVLLIGEYGNAPQNPPLSLQIVGDLKTRDGQNLKGSTIDIIPLEEGPTVVYAEYFVLDNAYPFVASGRGCDCPKERTTTVVRAVWSGGVRALSGEELGERERSKFRVYLRRGADTIMVHPYHLADLNDNDNNIDLCISEQGTPLWLEVEAHTAIDPRDDKNPFTKCLIVSRW